MGEILGSVGVAQSSYYRWKKSEGEKKVERFSSYELTVEERQMIEAVRVPLSAYPGGVATAGSLFIGLGNLRAFKRAGTGRALYNQILSGRRQEDGTRRAKYGPIK